MIFYNTTTKKYYTDPLASINETIELLERAYKQSQIDRQSAYSNLSRAEEELTKTTEKFEKAINERERLSKKKNDTIR